MYTSYYCNNFCCFTQTTTPTRQPPRQVAGKGDEQLVEQLMQQIEQLRNEGSEKDREIAEVQTTLRDERLQRERAIAKERREKGELLQRLQQEQEDKHNVQKDLDEARTQIKQLSEEKANLQQLLNEKQREKATIEEMLSDADAVIERYKQRQRSEVLNIPSHDIQLTGTELGRGSYGGEMHNTDIPLLHYLSCSVISKA